MHGAVVLDHVRTPGAAVQAVDVLGDYREALVRTEALLEGCEGKVSRVGRCRGAYPPRGAPEFPYVERIRPEGHAVG